MTNEPSESLKISCFVKAPIFCVYCIYISIATCSNLQLGITTNFINADLAYFFQIKKFENCPKNSLPGPGQICGSLLK